MNTLKHWRRPELAGWPTVGKLFGLRDELDRLFEGHFTGANSESSFASAWNPALDVYEDKDSVFVNAELPGMKKEEIDVSLHDGVLTISGERKSEEKFADAETYRSERFVGRFQRSVTLPSEVKAEQVNAHYKDGILNITLPKAERAKSKQIEVKID